MTLRQKCSVTKYLFLLLRKMCQFILQVTIYCCIYFLTVLCPPLSLIFLDEFCDRINSTDLILPETLFYHPNLITSIKTHRARECPWKYSFKIKELRFQNFLTLQNSSEKHFFRKRLPNFWKYRLLILNEYFDGR